MWFIHFLVVIPYFVNTFIYMYCACTPSIDQLTAFVHAYFADSI